jgi:hypothetical protein
VLSETQRPGLNAQYGRQCGALGRKAEIENAALFAANTLPIMEAIRRIGVTDLRGIAATLTSALMCPVSNSSLCVSARYKISA